MMIDALQDMCDLVSHHVSEQCSGRGAIFDPVKEYGDVNAFEWQRIRQGLGIGTLRGAPYQCYDDGLRLRRGEGGLIAAPLQPDANFFEHPGRRSFGRHQESHWSIGLVYHVDGQFLAWFNGMSCRAARHPRDHAAGHHHHRRHHSDCHCSLPSGSP